MKVLGVSPWNVAGWRDPAGSNKWAPYFRALGEHMEVVEVLRAPRTTASLVRRSVRRATRRRVSLGTPWNPQGFETRSRLLERELAKREGRYDLVFQLQTLHGPGTRPRPYTICTDNTHALLMRLSPAGRGVPRERAAQWQAHEAEVARNARYVFTWSEFARGSFIEDYGCDPDRVVVCGAGANLVLDDVPDRSALPPLAVFVGYDFERKGGRELLAAWADVERRVPGARLAIAGPRDPRPSTAKNVSWMGPTDRAALAALYREATVFVLPSLFEPLGLVFLEAMGNALPVVASDCCAMPELVGHEETGLLVPPEDVGALADALVALLADPQRAATMGRAGHAAVLERHMWSHVGRRMAEPLLGSLVA